MVRAASPWAAEVSSAPCCAPPRGALAGRPARSGSSATGVSRHLAREGEVISESLSPCCHHCHRKPPPHRPPSIGSDRENPSGTLRFHEGRCVPCGHVRPVLCQLS